MMLERKTFMWRAWTWKFSKLMFCCANTISGWQYPFYDKKNRILSQVPSWKDWAGKVMKKSKSFSGVICEITHIPSYATNTHWSCILFLQCQPCWLAVALWSRVHTVDKSGSFGWCLFLVIAIILIPSIICECNHIARRISNQMLFFIDIACYLVWLGTPYGGWVVE